VVDVMDCGSGGGGSTQLQPDWWGGGVIGAAARSGGGRIGQQTDRWPKQHDGDVDLA
jgi:hypothetical protein